MPRLLRVFLCHASQDKSAVRGLYDALKSKEWIDPWLDKAKILPGQDWEMVIEKAVEDSDVVIICLSNQSVTKEGFVQKEIRYAYDIALEKPESTIFLIPLRLDDCPVPRRLRQFHYVDYFGLQKRTAYSNLLEALQVRYDQKIKSEDVGRVSSPRESTPRKRQAFSLTYFLPQLKIAAVVLVIAIVGYLLWQGFASIPTSPNLTKTPLATFTIVPPTKIITPTPTKTIVPTPTLGIGSTMIGAHGETLVYVPAGEFTMGSDNGAADEKPVHTVYLDAFWIDQTEVTNKQYQACVDAGMCEPPSDISSYTHPSYYGNSEFDDYPVIYVNWDKANRYCEVWSGTGGDLPTEAQWEKAARGTDGRTYPWGEDISCDKANYQSSCVGDTSPVRSYDSGKSPYDVYDMAGNVWEWVNDYYQSDYYTAMGDNASNPKGPLSGNSRVLRGGSWNYDDLNARSAYRYWFVPTFTSYYIGFRCSRSP